MGVFSIFKKGFDPEEFDKELNQVNESITTTQEQLFRLNKSKRLIKKKIIHYLILAYVLINIIVYTRIPSEIQGKNKIQRFFKGQNSHQLLFFFGYPAIVYGIVWFFDSVFKMLINKRKDRLKKLQKKQKQKLDELKRITNFNTTNALLKKYEVEESNQKMPASPANKPTEGQVLTNRNVPAKEGMAKGSATGGNTKVPAAVSAAMSKNEASKSEPSKRTIQDRLLDLIIGSDNDESIESRYALICYNCLAHNGLAPPGCKDPFEVKYLCMKCGFLNGKMEQAEVKTTVNKENTPDSIDAESGDATEEINPPVNKDE